MEEKEDNKYYGRTDVCGFEEFVEAVPNSRQRHDGQIGLGKHGNNPRPIHNTGLPLLDHVAFPDVIYDKREGVDQSQDEHGVTGPVMEDLEFLMRNPSQRRDHVCFRAQGSIQESVPLHIRQTCKTHSTKGSSPSAIHPARVASGGLLP